METKQVRKLGIMYKWYDKETDRFYTVLFNEQGELIRGSSCLREERDGDDIMLPEITENFDWAECGVIFERHLKVCPEIGHNGYTIKPFIFLG